MKFTPKETYIIELDVNEMALLRNIFKASMDSTWASTSGKEPAKKLIGDINDAYNESTAYIRNLK